MSELQIVEEPVEDIDGTQDTEIQSLGSRLSDVFTEYKDARKETENEWLKDLRQFQGMYEPEVLARLNESGARSKVFVGLTRTKVMAAYSRIVDLLFQHGDSYFGIEPTPIPQLDPLKAMQMREQAVMQITAASGGMAPELNEDLIAARMSELEEEFLEAEQIIAKEAAEKMAVEIHDQLIEANAEQKLKEAILESTIFGSGAIKAGTIRIDRVQSYSRIQDPTTGQTGFALSQIEKAMPEVESVSIFDLYPDPYCTSLDDCEGLFD